MTTNDHLAAIHTLAIDVETLESELVHLRNQRNKAIRTARAQGLTLQQCADAARLAVPVVWRITGKGK